MSQTNLASAEDLLRYQLRSALTMEQHSLDALDELQDAARDKKLKGMFSHHADETREQIDNLEKVFGQMGFEVSKAPSPATTGIKTQATGLLEKAEPKLHNQIALMSALGNEHFEIASYTCLILMAESLNASDSVKLLTANLDQEVHTSEELRRVLKEMMS